MAFVMDIPRAIKRPDSPELYSDCENAEGDYVTCNCKQYTSINYGRYPIKPIVTNMPGKIKPLIWHCLTLFRVGGGR